MQMPIPDDWDGLSTCRWAVCWPDSIKWKAILYGLIGQPYQGRFWDEDTGNIVDTQHAFYPMYLYNFNLKGVIMSCDDSSIGTALNNIANSIALLANRGSTQGCCDSPQVIVNNTIQGTVVAPGSGDTVPVYGSQPPIVLEPGTYPDNYDTLEDYLIDKCRIANMITDGFILSIRGLGAFTVFNVTALAGLIGLALASVIIFPPSAIPIMIAAVIALGLEIAILDSWADEMEAQRETIVCDLYESDGVEAAIAVLSDFLDATIALIGTTSVIGITIKTIALLLLNSDTLNQLFNGAAALGYPDADCSNCGVGSIVAIINNGVQCTIEDVGDDNFIVTPQFQSGNNVYEAVFGWNTDENLSGFTGPMLLTEVSVESGSVGGSVPANAWRTFNQSFNQVYSANTPPVGPCSAYFVVQSEFIFTLRVVLVEAC